jgi:hypothetical protein
MTSLDPPDEELHLLYLEWCSTQVARRFLELSHDEVWERSRSAASAESGSTPSSAGEPPEVVGRIPGYLELVRKTTLLLAREMNLPAFREWKVEYAANPGAFHAGRLGH